MCPRVSPYDTKVLGDINSKLVRESIRPASVDNIICAKCTLITAEDSPVGQPLRD